MTGEMGLSKLRSGRLPVVARAHSHHPFEGGAGLPTRHSHGELELELDGGCVIRIPLPQRLLAYGLGMSLLALIRDPFNAIGRTQ